MSVFSSPFKEPFHNPFGSPFNGPGVGGGGAAPDPSTTTFNVTDNGGEPFAVSEGDFLVRT